MKAVTGTYEKIYYTLWETGQRYGNFARFRVIGNSHDSRMIPMLEIGEGQACIFCLCGLNGTDRQSPELLVQMGVEYCRAYEAGWLMADFYDVRHLLSKVRICLIPLLNPDGYEICKRGYTSIRNPIYRQMLRMQNAPHGEFSYNARGMNLSGNFPTSYYMRRKMGEEPASENETRALIRIFQEYDSKGLLTFFQSGKRIVCYRGGKGFSGNQKSYRLARHLQNCSSYRLEKSAAQEHHGQGRKKPEENGSPEQFYTDLVKQPAMLIETPGIFSEKEGEASFLEKCYEEIHLLPLEYIYSLDL